MAIKVLLFGDNNNIQKLVALLKNDKPQFQSQNDEIIVDNIKLNSKNFLFFSIKDRYLVSSQAAGANALIYFLKNEIPIYKQKQELIQLLNQSKELEGIPLIIALQTASIKNFNVKQIILELQLFKIRDRASMVKEIDFNTMGSINETFDWIQGQNNIKNSRLFDAQPRVVRTKQKYRQQPRANEKTYQNLIADKKFKGLNSIEQEQKYLNLQKERIKQESMQNQLNNFNRNKKKMTPYDIKPSTNPRIQPNLNFFLKDSKNQKPQQHNIKIQTDEFKPKPPSPKYVPKKIGVDTSTQVEDNELFNFNREVQPILNVLITKTLQFASLQIQQEQEMLKLAKYKDLYNEKKKKQKQHHREQLQAQQRRIKQKQQLLKRFKQKQNTQIQIFKKIQCYKIAGAFTVNLYKTTAQSLFEHGLFPNHFQDQLHTQYVDFLLKKTNQSIQILKKSETQLHGHFDSQIIKSLTSQSKQPRERINKLKKQAQNRRINISQTQRIINIYYEHSPNYMTNFARYFNKYCDKTLDQYHKTYQQKLKQVQYKITMGQISQDSLIKFKNQQLNELTKNQKGLLLQTRKVAFTMSSNQFQSVPMKDKKVSLQILSFDKNGDLIERINSNSKISNNAIIFNNNLRDKSKLTNMDQGFIIDLEKNLENVSSYILIVKIHDLILFTKPQNAHLLKNSVYGIQYYQYNLPIFKQSLQKQIKIQDLIKVPQNPDDLANLPAQSSLITSYVLTNKSEVGGWYLQQINNITKGMNAQQQQSFKHELCSYYKGTLVSDKEEHDEQQQEQIKKQKKISRQKSKEQSRDKKRKSSKVIKQEVVRKKKITFVSRAMPLFKINLKNQFVDIYRQLQDQVNKFPQFLAVCQFGWKLTFKGSDLSNINQLKKFKKIGDIKLERKPQQIIIEHQEKVEQSNIKEKEEE